MQRHLIGSTLNIIGIHIGESDDSEKEENNEDKESDDSEKEVNNEASFIKFAEEMIIESRNKEEYSNVC